jgi:ketosteroid isomerase-like protein
MKVSKSLGLVTLGAVIGALGTGYAGLTQLAQASEAKSSLEQRVLRMEDEAAIRQVYARYMFYLDHRDMVRYSELFTEDGVVLADQGKWEGRAAMQKMFEPKPGADGKPRPVVEEMTHMMSMDFVMRLDGNKAETWGKYFAFFHAKPGVRDRATVSGIGGHDDILVKVNGEWKFKKREILKEVPVLNF